MGGRVGIESYKMLEAYSGSLAVADNHVCNLCPKNVSVLAEAEAGTAFAAAQSA